jgi:hypothetical protein
MQQSLLRTQTSQQSGFMRRPQRGVYQQIPPDVLYSATAGWMMSWTPPASRSEALARLGDIFPNIEEQGRVCRALARLPDGEVVNLFAAPSKELVKATLAALLAESTGELFPGQVPGGR